MALTYLGPVAIGQLFSKQEADCPLQGGHVRVPAGRGALSTLTTSPDEAIRLRTNLRPHPHQARGQKGQTQAATPTGNSWPGRLPRAGVSRWEATVMRLGEQSLPRGAALLSPRRGGQAHAHRPLVLGASEVRGHVC